MATGQGAGGGGGGDGDDPRKNLNRPSRVQGGTGGVRTRIDDLIRRLQEIGKCSSSVTFDGC